MFDSTAMEGLDQYGYGIKKGYLVYYKYPRTPEDPFSRRRFKNQLAHVKLCHVRKGSSIIYYP